MDVKLKAVDALSQEIESLKVVVDLRNAEICQLKQSNGELQKQVIYILWHTATEFVCLNTFAATGELQGS